MLDIPKNSVTISVEPLSVILLFVACIISFCLCFGGKSSDVNVA